MATKKRLRSAQHRGGSKKAGCGRAPDEFKPSALGCQTGKRRRTNNRATIWREILNRKIWIVAASSAEGYGFRIIDKTRTAQEAADEYARTLPAISRLIESNFKIDDLREEHANGA